MPACSFTGDLMGCGPSTSGESSTAFGGVMHLVSPLGALIAILGTLDLTVVREPDPLTGEPRTDRPMPVPRLGRGVDSRPEPRRVGAITKLTAKDSPARGQRDLHSRQPHCDGSAGCRVTP
jgi:hypothetical protein